MPRQRERQEASPTRPSSKSELAALHLRLRSHHLPARQTAMSHKGGSRTIVQSGTHTFETFCNHPVCSRCCTKAVARACSQSPIFGVSCNSETSMTSSFESRRDHSCMAPKCHKLALPSLRLLHSEQPCASYSDAQHSTQNRSTWSSTQYASAGFSWRSRICTLK